MWANNFNLKDKLYFFTLKFVSRCGYCTDLRWWEKKSLENGVGALNMASRMCMMRRGVDQIIRLTKSLNKGTESCERAALDDEFPWFGCNFIYTIVVEKHGYHKLCAKWVPGLLCCLPQQGNLIIPLWPLISDQSGQEALWGSTDRGSGSPRLPLSPLLCHLSSSDISSDTRAITALYADNSATHH